MRFNMNPFWAAIIAAGAGGAEPLPIAGEYIQPFTYADGTTLISLPGWATYDAAGVTTEAAGRNRLQVINGQLASIGGDSGDYPTGSLSFLRDVGSANQVVRFKFADFLEGTTSTPAPGSNVRVIIGATDRQNALVLSVSRYGGTLHNMTVSKLVAGIESGVGSFFPRLVDDFGRNVDAGDTIELTLRGGFIRVACNGVSLNGVGFDVSVYTPGTLAGFGSSMYDVRFDDYYCAPLTATSVSVNQGLSFWPASDTGRLVTLTGTTTGTPTALQTRVISAVDNSEIVPWTTNATAVFGSGTFSVSVFEPIGNLTTRARYITQVRPIEDVNGWGNYHAHAIGPVFVLYGQSNSALRDAYSGGGTETESPNAYVVYNSNAGKNGSVDPWSRGNESSSGLHMYSKVMAERLGAPCGVICGGQGSQPIESLKPGGSFLQTTVWSPSVALNLWDTLKAACNKVGATGYVRLMDWTQGEAEAGGAADPNVPVYQSDFVDLAAAFRTDLAIGPTAPLAISVIGRFVGTPTYSDAQTNRGWSMMRENLSGLPSLVSNCEVSSSLMHLPLSDEIHLSGVGFREINRRDAQTAAKLLGVSTYDGRGPIITGGTRSGAVITMAVNLNGAASIAGSSVTGFDVSADNFATLLTVSDVSVSGSNVVITLAADPGAAVKVRSYWGYNPDQSSVITGTYSDGTTIQAEPIYNPITVS